MKSISLTVMYGLQLYMREMIRDRLSSDVRDKHDLFSSLIYANKEELGGASLSEEELMGLCALTFLLPQCSMLKDLAGNIFIFLVAGHEVCQLRPTHLTSRAERNGPDNCAYTFIHICSISLVSRGTGKNAEAH